MRFIKLSVIFFLAAGFQWFLDTRLALFGFAPEVIFLAVLAAAVAFSPAAAVAFGFLCGFYVDFLSGSLFGAHALVYTCAAYLTGLLHKRMDLGSLATQMFYCAVLCAAGLLAFGALALVFSGRFLWPGWLGFFLISALTALVSPVVFLLVSFMHAEEK